MRTETWYESLFETLCFLCPHAPDGINLENEPEWVVNVWKQLVHQVMPSVSLKPHEVTPRRLGRLLGQEGANWTAIRNAFAENSTPEKMARGEAVLEQLKAHPENGAASSVVQAVKLVEQVLKANEPLVSLRIRITVDALSAAWLRADEHERLAFFQGIVEGLSKPGLPSRFTDATPIYQRLLIHCKEVEKLKSVRELREFLLARGLTPQSLGEPKRLEKLCQRIGLSFAEPGRPKRTN